ncbi:MAG: sulfate adenylyltransferase subunit CysD [Myxococcales bacterium]|nr:sulfate adenylyltransferase subunit CysD [Myxococcales bacterium]
MIPATETYEMNHLDQLEAEAIYIFREVMAQARKPVMLYSVGKDSSVLVHLARKAFAPAKLPFPLLHIDTGFKFPEMYEFRDKFVKEIGAELIVHQGEEGFKVKANPWDLGTVACCGLLKTGALLESLKQGGYDAAFGGARRDEEKSRAKERVFSFRDTNGQWDPQAQRPELWDLYNGHVRKDESIRVFPLSNWTEMDIWNYIDRESIPIVPMYYAEQRDMVVRGDQLIPFYPGTRLLPNEVPEKVMSRFRTLGCSPCTGAVHSNATTVKEIIQEVSTARQSERITRIIDHDQEGSMEQKKREGYF